MSDGSRSGRRTARGYDRLARAYRWLEWPVFGRRLQHARTCLLGELPPARRVLVLGDGDGRLLAALRRVQPAAEIVSVDLSPAMLRQQRRRLGAEPPGAAAGVRWICADALTRQFEADRFDLLVTAFFLDCFDEAGLRHGLPRWLVALAPGGHWLIVDFVVPDGCWRSRRARFWLACMHALFRLATGCPNRRLLDWRSIPTGRESRLLARRDDRTGMIRAELFEVP